MAKNNINLDIKSYNKRINKIVGEIDIDKDRVYQEIAIIMEKKLLMKKLLGLKAILNYYYHLSKTNIIQLKNKFYFTRNS